MAFTDAQVAAYLRDNNVTDPTRLAQIKSVFGLDDAQIARAQQLVTSNDPSVNSASQNYQNAVAGTNLNNQNLNFYNSENNTGTGVTQKNPSEFNMQNYLSNYGSNPYSQATQASSAGNLKNAQQAVAANRVNQITPYGNLQYQQTGTDAQGNPIWSATQTLSPELQGAFGAITGNLTNQYSQGFNPNLPSVGINPGETYSDAIMRRLQPQQERQSKSLDVQLANQGIMPGSEAYNIAKTQLAQAQNDQLTSAIVGGFQTGLAANQQGYNQALTNYQLPLATLNQFRTATAPNYVNPSQQATVAAPDYLGAYNASQNNALGLQNAQAAANNSLYSGLFGLGTAALSNPSAVSSLYNTMSTGLNNAYSSLFG